MKLKVRTFEAAVILAAIVCLIALTWAFIIEHSDLKPNSVQYYEEGDD